ncbi:hypothetical protein EDD38_7524 [Kitasatospora cineracea]|uniref:Uncharacterized protein n=1 Tax=Kitasatospora cineracea TaxID=88074 RepID=A0A3N4R3T2_9ACTN|nr:hypothetical protein EDD38_7391 [Kitasatospora cineracea]RPE27379.1 hypothetical protein EDD38_7524 [Kitasatospora cineracea]
MDTGAGLPLTGQQETDNSYRARRPGGGMET